MNWFALIISVSCVLLNIKWLSVRRLIIGKPWNRINAKADASSVVSQLSHSRFAMLSFLRFTHLSSHSSSQSPSQFVSIRSIAVRCAWTFAFIIRNHQITVINFFEFLLFQQWSPGHARPSSYAVQFTHQCYCYRRSSDIQFVWLFVFYFTSFHSFYLHSLYSMFCQPKLYHIFL